MPAVELERDEEKTVKAVVKASENAVRDGA